MFIKAALTLDAATLCSYIPVNEALHGKQPRSSEVSLFTLQMSQCSRDASISRIMGPDFERWRTKSWHESEALRTVMPFSAASRKRFVTLSLSCSIHRHKCMIVISSQQRNLSVRKYKKWQYKIKLSLYLICTTPHRCEKEWRYNAMHY